MVMKPCERCGSVFNATGRTLSCDTCRPLVQRAARAEQAKRDRTRNPEANQQRQARYREAHREKLRAVQAAIRATEERRAYTEAKRSEYRFGGLRDAVLQRDGHRCQSCGATADVGYRFLVVHHRDGDDTHNEMANLVTLCRSCHPLFHAH